MKKITFLIAFLSITLTQAQVSLVKDINPGIGDGVTDQFIAFNNQLFFSANDGVNGHELWKSNGTLTGTVLLADLQTNVGVSSNPQRFFYSSSANEVYFTANASSSSTINYEPMKIDISGIPSTIKELQTSVSSGDASSYPMYFTEYSNKVYFSARSDINNNHVGVEVHFTDGTNAGTGVLKDINPDFLTGINPDNYTVSNGNLYFVALVNANSSNIPVTGKELYLSGGYETGTDLLLDINPGAGNSSPEYLTDFNNKLYFTADDGVNGRELWVTDGTVSGTQMILDLYSGVTGSNPENLTVYNNALYFSATHPSLGTEIFKMSTAESITSLKNIASGSGNSNPANLHVFNGTLYFSADDGNNGIELWSSTGFSSTTNMLKNINTDAATPDSNPNGFTEYFGELYFSANNGVNGRELWKTDGTNAGTVLVHDINISGDSNPSDLIVANNILFFSANDGSTGIELWKYQDSSLSVNDEELEASISIFPNPTSSSFSIETMHIVNKVSVYDVQGKAMKLFKEDLTIYDIDELTSGLYFVKISSDKGSITKKIIKQ